MFELHFPAPDAVELYGNGRLLFHHSGGSPALFLGKGRETIHLTEFPNAMLCNLPEQKKTGRRRFFTSPARDAQKITASI